MPPLFEEVKREGNEESEEVIQILAALEKINKDRERAELMVRDADEIEIGKYQEEWDRRQKEVEEYVRRLTTKADLEEMPQMMFRRLMHDDEILGAVSKHILDTMFPK